MATKTKPRKFKGFAVLDRGGKLVWGTIRTERAEAEKLFQKWNPDPTGQGMGAHVAEVTILIDQ